MKYKYMIHVVTFVVTFVFGITAVAFAYSSDSEKPVATVFEHCHADSFKHAEQLLLLQTRDVDEVLFHQTNLIPTKVNSAHHPSSKAIIKKDAVTLTFDRFLFPEGIHSNRYLHGFEYAKQTEILFTEISQNELFTYATVQVLNDNKLMIAPGDHPEMYQEQIDWLVNRIQELYQVQLVRTKKQIKLYV